MILILLTFIFFVMRVIPGDPITSMMGGTDVTQQYIEQIKTELGLNKPIWEQYVIYLSGVLTLNLGNSINYKMSVLFFIEQALPSTLELAICSMIFAIPFGISLGTVAARRKGSKIDSLITTASLVRWSMPIFWLGLILILIFSVYWPILPIGGQIDPIIQVNQVTGFLLLDSILTANLPALISTVEHLILPVIGLGTAVGVQLAMITRSNLIQASGQEYVRTERLGGVPEDQIYSKHILPNSLIPILTYAGTQFAIMVGGIVLLEQVFSWPGIGRLLVDAISARDFPMIQGIAIVIGLMVMAINTVVDILYAVLDPRVRY